VEPVQVVELLIAHRAAARAQPLHLVRVDEREHGLALVHALPVAAALVARLDEDALERAEERRERVRVRSTGARLAVDASTSRPAMTDHPLGVAMRWVTAQLQSDLALSATVAHNASMGSARERVIRDRLGPYLPSRFVTATGTAMNAAGGRSGELDVMVVDDTAGRPFVNLGGESVVPVELIYACLQIRTGVKPSDIGGAVENLASLLRLYPSEQEETGTGDGRLADERPFTAIVAYSASKDERELFEAFVEANLGLPRDQQAESLLVLGEFVVHVSVRLDDTCVDNPHGTYAPASRPAAGFWSTGSLGEDSTLAFYVLLSAALAAYRPPAFSPWAYAQAAGLLPSGGLARYWDRDGDPDELARRREGRRSG
jgi:hypothetical protein